MSKYKAIVRDLSKQTIEILGHETIVPDIGFENFGHIVLAEIEASFLVQMAVAVDSGEESSSAAAIAKYGNVNIPEVPGLEE